jgi:hypothetical protein
VPSSSSSSKSKLKNQRNRDKKKLVAQTATTVETVENKAIIIVETSKPPVIVDLVGAPSQNTTTPAQNTEMSDCVISTSVLTTTEPELPSLQTLQNQINLFMTRCNEFEKENKLLRDRVSVLEGETIVV